MPPPSSLTIAVDLMLRRLVPCLTVLALILVPALPLPFPSNTMPMLPVIAVYYWAIYRPDLLPIWSVFLLGLFYDTLCGTLPGVNVLILVLVYEITASQRKFFLGKSFLVSWLMFSLLAAGVSVVGWVIVVVINGKILPFLPVVVQYVTTVGLCPPLVRGLAQLQVRVLRQGV